MNSTRTDDSRRFLIWGISALVVLLLIATATFVFNQNGAAPTLPANDSAGTEAGNTDARATSAIAEGKSIVNDAGITIFTEDDRPANIRSATGSWNTDWNRHTIQYNELLSGGPPRDGIPSLDNPTFEAAAEARLWLANNEPIISVEINGEARAYPLQILTWHEIVNDELGGVPIAVTFCPLCNSALVFDRRFDGEIYEFGTSGLLRKSDLVMYDRTTESLWQQFTGEGIVGEHAGRQLDFVPSSIVSFADFQKAFPASVILSQDTGFNRAYGDNPYAGYDSIDSSPFLFDGELDGRLLPMARVVTVSLPDVDLAYPVDTLSDVGVINDVQGEQKLAIFHTDGTSSALGTTVIANAEDVGATGVFDPNVGEESLTFIKEGDRIVDEQTGSEWNILGKAIDGPLAGESLTPIVHADHFWFSWAAFKPDTTVYQQ